MKKLLLLAALLGFAGSALAQGTIAFANTGNNAFRIWTNNGAGTALGLPVQGRYRIGLYGSTDGGSLQLIAITTNGPGGFFSSGSPYALPDGYAEGATLTYQLRGWILAAGFSYEEAVLFSPIGPFGFSEIATTTLGGGTVIQGALFATTGTQLRTGFEIRPIPEPSGIALGLLGLGAMTLLRRNKQTPLR
jgi:hypothetical protein